MSEFYHLVAFVKSWWPLGWAMAFGYAVIVFLLTLWLTT